MTGFVSLVGAGPGDSDLLTTRATRRLREADVVFHDALIGREVLELAAGARLVNVGKRAGRPSIAQESIHRFLIESACDGERVVRLKGGDPFVLGRGGEEALALSRAAIPFEVVPGISSAFAVPAISGIPVTHRGLSSAVVVVSGHSSSSYGPVLGTLAPHTATVVVLMGLAKRDEIAGCLIERGWAPSTPTATLLRGATPEASTETSTLVRWTQSPSPSQAPGTLVVGEVVSLALLGPPDSGPSPTIEEKGVVV